MAMRASAQVDVNFNTFTDNVCNVDVMNASQLLTVQENDFIRTVEFTQPFNGVHVWTDNENAPPKNRVVVHRNTFTLDVNHETGIPARGIWLTQWWQDFGDQLSFVATNNTFDLDGTQAEGIRNVNYIDGLVAYNEFKGFGQEGMWLGTDQGRPVTGWSIVGNDFGDLDLRDGLWDIELDFWTENILVGQLQRADVMDFGSNNIVLDQFLP